MMLQLMLIQITTFLHLPEFHLPELKGFLAEESAQDVFEYLLVIGGISVAIIVGVAAFPGIAGDVASKVCDAIGGISGMTGISC